MKQVRKRVGRPAEPKAPHRPVLAARVPAEDYATITAAAKASGRTVSEELIWRARQSFAWELQVLDLQSRLLEWERAHKDTTTMQANAKRVVAETTDKHWEDQLRLHGYHKVHGETAHAWFPPGVDSITWIYENSTGRKILDAERERTAERAAELGAERAIEKLVGRATKPERN
jgi:hypothetical protein